MKQELTIDNLLEELNNWKPQDPMELIHIGQKQMAMILDHITNLKKERDMFNGSFEEMSKNYFEEQAKIKKAIEILDTYGCYNGITEDKLYSCLRGDNKNE